MKSILLVDDDPQLRNVFEIALSRHGYRVLVADSGSSALALARQHLPDLILTDVHMPDGDGSTLLKAIRLDPELRGKQVVLMTGRPDLVPPRKGMEDGADDYLLKPVSLGPLINCVEARFRRASVNWRVEDGILTRLRDSVPRQLPHEFFTPLAGIIGLTDVLRSSSGELTPTELGEIFDDIHLSALRLHRTLRNFLLILELQEAKPQALSSPLSASDAEDAVTTGVNETFRVNQRENDVTVKIGTPSLFIKADDLCRIAEELVDNACKFSRQGTPITVELGSDNRLVVTDEGRGMNPEETGKIGAFQQFDRKKHEQQGLGLGLVLVQKLAQLWNAKFALTSEPGKGTRIEVAFPSA